MFHISNALAPRGTYPNRSIAHAPILRNKEKYIANLKEVASASMFSSGVAIIEAIPAVRDTTAIADEEYSGYSSQHRSVLAVKLPPPIALDRNLDIIQKIGRFIKRASKLNTNVIRVSTLR